MMWYWIVLIVIGSPIYLVGYCWGAVYIWHQCMDDHPMRHASDYRMTDGYYPAFFAAFFWPLILLGIGLVKLAKRPSRQFWEDLRRALARDSKYWKG